MPRIEVEPLSGKWGHRRYWQIHLDPNELVTDSGKVIPYGFSAGVIDERGKVDVWTPAARVPRDYKAAARAVLKDARAKLVARGEIAARPHLGGPTRGRK